MYYQHQQTCNFIIQKAVMSTVPVMPNVIMQNIEYMYYICVYIDI